MKRIPYWPILAIPAILWCIGVFLNVLVFTFNMGTMPVVEPHLFWWQIAVAHTPVAAGALTDELHKIMVHQDHLKWLSDWIQLPNLGTASPGDLIQWLGKWLRPYALGAWGSLLWSRG